MSTTKRDAMTKIRTQAFARLLIQRQAQLHRVKADLLEMLIPVQNYEQFTEPEWKALQQINKTTEEALDKINEVFNEVSAIEP